MGIRPGEPRPGMIEGRRVWDAHFGMTGTNGSSPQRRLRLGCPSACSIVIVAFLAAPAWSADDAAGLAFFETKIRPVLVERCHECHSSQSKKPKGGLLLDTRDGIRRGGHSGAAVVPGNVEESLLFQAITGADGVDAMPPKGRLPDSTIADFRRWILMGAPDPRHGTSPGQGIRTRDGQESRLVVAAAADSVPRFPRSSPRSRVGRGPRSITSSSTSSRSMACIPLPKPTAAP